MKTNPFDEQKRIAQEKIEICESGFIGITAGIVLMLIGIIAVPIFM